MWLMLLKYARLALPLALFISGMLSGWYITSNHYQTKEAERLLLEAETLKQQQEKAREVSNGYQIKKGNARKRYLAAIDLLRKHCMSTDPTTGRPSTTTTGNGVPCEVAEAGFALMWIAEEQAHQLIGCQNANGFSSKK